MGAKVQRASFSGKNYSLERAIAFRKRLYAEARLASQKSQETLVKRFFLKIELSELEILQHEVWLKFFEEASLSRRVEVEYDSIISSRKMPDPYQDDALALAVTREYANAIARAVGRLADWIMTAAISRAGRIRVTSRLREAIWRYCLDFAARLSRWDPFGIWADRVVHVRWNPTTEDGSPDYEQLKKGSERRRKFFEQRVNMYWHEWLGAIERGIELRRVLSSGRSTGPDQEGGLVAVIRMVKNKNSDYTQRELAGKVDDIFSATLKRPTPLLKRWKIHGVTTLVEAFDNPETKNRVKKYISGVT
jgi:hypothetical protein